MQSLLRLVGLVGLFYLPSINLYAVTEVPINLGIGPSKFYVPEKLGRDDTKPFSGFRLHIKAVVNKALLEKNKRKIPEKFRKSLQKVEEVRVGFILIPESIMLGWRTVPGGPEIWGATWKPLSLGLPLRIGPARLSLSLGLVGTYAYVNTGRYKIPEDDDIEVPNQSSEPAPDSISYVNQVTHFFRPGAQANIDFEFAFTENFLVSVGASSSYYVPQKIGGTFTELGSRRDRSLYRIHEAYALLHYRIPYKASF
ncbi:MAG: hypothetical protein R3B45_09080 [Bdellovibrionota bacterium]